MLIHWKVIILISCPLILILLNGFTVVQWRLCPNFALRGKRLHDGIAATGPATAQVSGYGLLATRATGNPRDLGGWLFPFWNGVFPSCTCGFSTFIPSRCLQRLWKTITPYPGHGHLLVLRRKSWTFNFTNILASQLWFIMSDHNNPEPPATRQDYVGRWHVKDIKLQIASEGLLDWVGQPLK